jgi:hypothetical protein
VIVTHWPGKARWRPVAVLGLVVLAHTGFVGGLSLFAAVALGGQVDFIRGLAAGALIGAGVSAGLAASWCWPRE